MNNEQIIPPGQLLEQERKYLTDIVLKIKPNIVLESGTWYGGGSTLSLVKGLFENKKGTLHTVEEHYDYYKIANDFYKNSQYSEHIKLYHNSFVNVIRDMNLLEVDLIFLDGGDEKPGGHPKLDYSKYVDNYNLSENVQSFKIIEQKIKPNTHIILQDWGYGRGSFVKQYLIKENKMQNYKLEHSLSEYTGMAHLIKL